MFCYIGFPQIKHGKHIGKKKKRVEKKKNEAHWVNQTIKLLSIWKIIVLVAHGVKSLCFGPYVPVIAPFYRTNNSFPAGAHNPGASKLMSSQRTTFWGEGASVHWLLAGQRAEGRFEILKKSCLLGALGSCLFSQIHCIIWRENIFLFIPNLIGKYFVVLF